LFHISCPEKEQEEPIVYGTTGEDTCGDVVRGTWVSVRVGGQSEMYLD
jgi:hypothetical protein